jgi:glutamate synthase (NADPH/NADH) large chain
MGFSTAPLIALGCIMMRKCHLNTCPVGVATQDPVLRKKFAGQPEHVVNYLFMVAEEAREIMASLGVRRFIDLVGRVDLLQPRAAIDHWKADGLDLTPLLTAVAKPHPDTEVYCTRQQDHRIDRALDHKLIALAKKSIDQRKATRQELPIANTNRTVGAMLSYEVVKKWGADALPYDTVRFKFKGTAGQSFGAPRTRPSRPRRTC